MAHPVLVTQFSLLLHSFSRRLSHSVFERRLPKVLPGRCRQSSTTSSRRTAFSCSAAPSPDDARPQCSMTNSCAAHRRDAPTLSFTHVLIPTTNPVQTPSRSVLRVKIALESEYTVIIETRFAPTSFLGDEVSRHLVGLNGIRCIFRRWWFGPIRQ